MLKVQDPVSGSTITFYYRRPTTEERVAYQLSAYRLENGERRFHLGETRLKFGLEILTGFRQGDFSIKENDQVVPLDPVRHPDWRELLSEEAGDLVAYLGQQIFEGMRLAVNRETDRD